MDSAERPSSREIEGLLWLAVADKLQAPSCA